MWVVETQFTLGGRTTSDVCFVDTRADEPSPGPILQGTDLLAACQLAIGTFAALSTDRKAYHMLRPLRDIEEPLEQWSRGIVLQSGAYCVLLVALHGSAEARGLKSLYMLVDRAGSTHVAGRNNVAWLQARGFPLGGRYMPGHLNNEMKALMNRVEAEGAG